MLLELKFPPPTRLGHLLRWLESDDRKTLNNAAVMHSPIWRIKENSAAQVMRP